MKNCILLAVLASLLHACSGPNHETLSSESTEQYKPPSPNTIVAQSSMPIKEDKLNHQLFSVTIRTNENSATKGAYSVETEWGYNIAEGSFTMPAGGEHLKPVMRPGEKPYTYIIGFNYGKDSAFYEYFQASGRASRIEMKYIKVYSFK